MRNKILTLLVASTLPLLCDSFTQAQIAPGKYVIWFTDKAFNQFSLQHPEQFLSLQAITRKSRYAVPVDSTDLPVTASYLDSLRRIGLDILSVSRWFNFAVVAASDTALLDSARRFPFVKMTQKSFSIPELRKSLDDKWNRESVEESGETFTGSDYGVTFSQIHLHWGDSLHAMGYRGRGIRIAVLDAGFYRADSLPAFDSLNSDGRILGTWDFVSRSGNVYDNHTHGMNVLSILAGNVPGTFIGTAPEASYWLLRTEDTESEYLVEEFYWVAGAEYADSAGADIIHASLGYTVFDNPVQNHTYSDMNGRTAIVSRAAAMAARKGMLVVISAGNEGNKDWNYISAPADADSILAVGAIMYNKDPASFSSRGPSFDRRIKPDVSAVGVGVYLQNSAGRFSTGSGTSFASPIITGLAACLWQAYPELTAQELRTVILQSCDHFSAPDSLTGYGIPNFVSAFQRASMIYARKADSGKMKIIPNPSSGEVWVNLYFNPIGEFHLSISDLSGTIHWKEVYAGIFFVPGVLPLNLSSLRPGMYFLHYQDKARNLVVRFIKL